MGVNDGSGFGFAVVGFPVQSSFRGRALAGIQRSSLAIDDQDLLSGEGALGRARFGDRDTALVEAHREVAARSRRPAAAIGELSRSYDLGGALDEAAVVHFGPQTLIEPLRKSLPAIFTLMQAGAPAAKAASSAGPSSSTRSTHQPLPPTASTTLS